MVALFILLSEVQNYCTSDLLSLTLGLTTVQKKNSQYSQQNSQI